MMRAAFAAATIAAAVLGADAVPAVGLLRSSVDVTTTQDLSASNSLSSMESAIATSMSAHFGYEVVASVVGADGISRHGKKAISGHMLRHENFRLSANVLQLPEGDY